MSDSHSIAITVVPVDALAPLVDRAESYVAAARADATRRAYAADQAAFEAWCAEQGLPALPASPACVAVYLAAMADAGRKVGTIERALAGIVHAHRQAGHDWTKGNRAIRDVLSGIRRRLGSAPARKAPVLDDDLRKLVDTLGEDLAGLRDRALLVLGWFGAFRRSELCALRVEDLAFTREGIVTTLRRSKTDQEGRGSEKGIPFASAPALCPVRAVRAWLDAAGITAGPVFRSVDRHGRVSSEALNDRSVARIVQRAAANAGLDSATFAGHSLRSGFVTTAAKRGRSLDAIMRQTGHRSERVARGYIRHASLFVDNAAIGLA